MTLQKAEVFGFFEFDLSNPVAHQDRQEKWISCFRVWTLHWI